MLKWNLFSSHIQLHWACRCRTERCSSAPGLCNSSRTATHSTLAPKSIYVSKLSRVISIHSRLCCQCTTQRCQTEPVCVGALRRPCRQASAGTDSGLCTLSDRPSSSAEAALRDRSRQTSLGLRSGGATWTNKKTLFRISHGCFLRSGSHLVCCIPSLFNKLFDVPDALGYVVNGRELRGQVLHRWDLNVQRRDGVPQILHWSLTIDWEKEKMPK